MIKIWHDDLIGIKNNSISFGLPDATVVVDKLELNNCTKITIEQLKDHPGIMKMTISTYNANVFSMACTDYVTISGHPDQISVVAFPFPVDSKSKID